jgi:hypothetical protein
MKKLIRAILGISFAIAFTVFIFLFSFQRRQNLEASLPVAARSVGLVESPVTGNTPETEAAPGRMVRAKINPDWDETFLEVLDIDLDDDRDLEQVLVAREAATAHSPISIVIADFLPATGSYFRVWEGRTRAEKPNALVIQPRDLLGEGSLDLLFFGIDGQDLQTLTVFHRQKTGSSPYSIIFSGSGLSIELEPAAQEGAAMIVVQEAEPRPDSPLDQKRTTFSWNPGRGQYLKSAETIVEGEKVEQRYIAGIITGKAEDFETFLDGMWIREGPEKERPTLLSFDREDRTVSIHSARETQEWDWEGSNAGGSGIYARISHSAVPDMLRLLGIDLVGVDRIRVQAASQQFVKFALKEDWNGTYRRSRGESKPKEGSGFSLLPRDGPVTVQVPGSGTPVEVAVSALEGSYSGEADSVLALGNDGFRMEDRNGTISGRYSFFLAGKELVLDLILMDEKSVDRGRRSYAVSVELDEEKNVAKLLLDPVILMSDRAEPQYKPVLVFARTPDQGRR